MKRNFLLYLVLVQGAIALVCYECTYDSSQDQVRGDKRCKNYGNSNTILHPSMARECYKDEDVCTLTVTVEANGRTSYQRGCDYSSNFNHYKVRCERCSAWGKKHRQCVCHTEYCNHGQDNTPFLVLLITLATLVIIV